MINMLFRASYDGSALYAGLEKSKNVAKAAFKGIGDSLGSSLSGGGGLKAALGGFLSIASLKSVTDYASEVKNVSTQLGITYEEYQRFQQGSESQGIAFEKLGNAIESIGSKRREAVESNDELMKSFERFGVTAADLNNSGKRNVDILFQMANAAESLQSAADREAFGDLVGTKGKRFLSLLQDIKSYTPISIISDSEIDRIEDATNKVEALGSGIKGLLAKSVSRAIEGFEYNKKAAGGGILGSLFGAIAAPIVGIRDFAETIFDGFSDSLAVDGNKKFDALPLPNKNADPLFEDKRKVKEEKSSGERRIGDIGEKPISDRLSRIGLFVGGVPSSIQTYQKDSMTELRSINRGIQKLSDEVRKGLE